MYQATGKILMIKMASHYTALHAIMACVIIKCCGGRIFCKDFASKKNRWSRCTKNGVTIKE